jgi:tetratricopeptide (TPR) repeat protein
MLSRAELSSGQESSTGNPSVNINCKLLLLVLLAEPASGFGRQQPASTFESLVAAAQQAQAASDFSAAVSDYKQAVKVRADMPELWANLGLVQHQAGDVAGATVSFRTANRLNPSLYVPNLFLGLETVRAGKPQEAIPFLVKAEKINKTDPQTPLALGRAYFATGQFSAAARELERATTLDPKLGAAWFALGIARLNQVEVDARTMSIIAKDSAFAGALYAESLEKQSRFSEAASLYSSLFDSQPQPPCIHSEFGFALLRHRDAAGAAAEFAGEEAAHPECGLALLGQTRLAIDSGDNEQAVRLLGELWDRDHGFVVSNTEVLLDGLSSDAAANIGGYFARPDVVMAEDLRTALLASIHGSGPAFAERFDGREPGGSGEAGSHSGAEFYAAGKYERCAQKLDPALAHGSEGELRLLAECSYFAGDNERVVAAAAALKKIQLHSPEALYWSIQADERLALQALARFQQLESDSARSHVLLGDIYDQLERFDDAQAEYSKALQIAPGDLAASLGLASTYLSNNNSEKAMEIARMALERNPQDPELNLMMAETKVAENQFAAAEPYLMKSLNVKPQMIGHVHGLLGKVYAETGRTREAIDQLKMGVTSDENGSIDYLLARLYRQIGDPKDASIALERVKSIKEQSHSRGVKLIEDPELSALEYSPGQASTP